MFNIKCVCHTSLKLRVALLRVNCSALACRRIVTDAKGGWGALNSRGAGRPRGNRDGSTARLLIKSTCFRTGNHWLRAANRGHEPKTKTPQGRVNFWLGRTASNHDKENQNLLSYH